MLRKGVKSFYNWCNENNHCDYLDLWDYELNNEMPCDISFSTSKSYYFKCENNLHESYSYNIRSLTIENSKGLHCPVCNSIYQWCIDNNRHDIINAWDNEKNDIDMKYISKSSSKKAWFKFEYYSYYYPISYITQKNKKATDPVSKYNNSLGHFLILEYGVDAINKYWSSKNTKSPFEYDKGSGQKVWIKCEKKDYHDDYLINCYSFVNGSRCPMCASKIIHPLDSFASYNKKRYGDDWLEKCWCDDNTVDPFKISINNNTIKVHLRCLNVNYHDFWITPYNYDKELYVCHYCNIKGPGSKVHPLDSIGAKYPELLDIWSDLNECLPFDLSVSSHKIIYLKCENNEHEDYRKRVYEYTRNPFCGCPYCSNYISSYEQMTRDHLKNNYQYTIKYEYDCNIIPINPLTNYKLPFDNEIVELKLICEVMGRQHYELNGFHNLSAKHNKTTPEEEFKYTQWKDQFKKQFALNNGYNYLELPYYLFKTDEYKNVIDNKINEIIISKSVTTDG